MSSSLTHLAFSKDDIPLWSSLVLRFFGFQVSFLHNTADAVKRTPILLKRVPNILNAPYNNMKGDVKSTRNVCPICLSRFLSSSASLI